MMRYDRERAGGLPRARFLQAVRAEGIPLSEGNTDLVNHPFIEHTLNSRTFQSIYTRREIDDWRERTRCPSNGEVLQEVMWFGQNLLLGEASDMEDIAMAMQKVARNADKLRQG
jgi:hypothetical protein